MNVQNSSNGKSESVAIFKEIAPVPFCLSLEKATIAEYLSKFAL